MAWQQWLRHCPFQELVLALLCPLIQLIVDKPSSLNELSYFICYMACKQEPVSRLYFVGKSHECQRIATEGESHPPTDNLWRFLHVIDSSNGETPVGNRAPEVRTHEIVPEVLAPDIVHRFAHQRSSHGRAVRSEAAIQTDDTSVHPALGALPGRPPHDTRIRLTAAQRPANENALG